MKLQKILALVPKEWIKRIPFFREGMTTTKTVEVRQGNILSCTLSPSSKANPDKEREELRVIMTSIFGEKDE